MATSPIPMTLSTTMHVLHDFTGDGRDRHPVRAGVDVGRDSFFVQPAGLGQQGNRVTGHPVRPRQPTTVVTPAFVRSVNVASGVLVRKAPLPAATQEVDVGIDETRHERSCLPPRSP